MSYDPFINVFFGGAALLCVGTAVLVAWRLMEEPWARSSGDGIGLLLTVVGWVLILVGSYCICLFTMPWYLGFLTWFVLLVVMGMTVHRLRVERRKTLLDMLATSVRWLMPLAGTAEAFARETGGATGRQAGRLADSMSSGMPLPAALASPPLVSRRTRALLALGDSPATLEAVLVEASRDRDEAAAIDTWIANLLYLCSLVLVALIVLTFMMLKIVPAFRQIFEDFDMELPAISELLINLSDLFGYFWFIFLPLQIFVVGLFAYSLLLYMGWIDFDLPWLRRLWRPFDQAVVLRGLALVVETGQPLNPAVDSLARNYPNASIRASLASAGEQIAGGMNWREALWQANLLRRADAALLEAAERAGNLAWALRLIADAGQRRLAWRLRAALEIVSPLVLLFICMIAAFVVIALFMPLIKVVEALS